MSDTVEKPCPDCEGSGVRLYELRTYGGRRTGEEELRDCETCSGEGRVEVEAVESAEEAKAA
ncbi:MAG TPA: hypothetical protein VFX97_16980 [Pyrinomonadaceae bacterium]|nr:hypothetical protein [Pyrinomonadaceae bacterium]